MNKALLEVLKSHTTFIITSHLSPDGDALGSMSALGLLLQNMGKTVSYYLKDAIPKRFKFLFKEEVVQQNLVFTELPSHAVLIAVDCSNWARTGWDSLDQVSLPVLNIDHHPDNDHFGLVNWVDDHAAAAGELIYTLAQALNIMDQAMATAIYVALVTDTGGFRFCNTTAKTHAIAAKLVAQNINHATIYDQVLNTQSLESFYLLLDVLQTAVIKDGIASMILRQSDLKKHQLTLGNTPELINYIRSIEGVKIAILCTEQPDKTTKVSLRSRQPIDVSRLARYYEGGGHKLAAGCHLADGVDVSREKLTQKAQEIIREYN